MPAVLPPKELLCCCSLFPGSAAKLAGSCYCCSAVAQLEVAGLQLVPALRIRMYCWRVLTLFLLTTSSAFCRPVSPKSKLSNSPLVMASATVEKKDGTSASVEIPNALKLIFGAGGIYASFLYYGTLQEDVFHYKAADGTRFKEGGISSLTKFNI